MKGKTNLDFGEELGAFVGTPPPTDDKTAVPTKTRGRTRISGDNFHATGKSAATSNKAARTPTHWRRGGFVTRMATGGSVANDEGVKEKPVPEDERQYKKGGWMKGAVKHPGALHRSLGVPQGQKIPAAKIAKAAHSSNPTLKKRAVLAQTFAKHRP